MNGVVFQISDSMITASDDHRSPNQLKSSSPSHWFTKPDSRANAQRQLNADTTVTMPYGMRIDVRTRDFPTRMRYMTNANMKPSTNSTATVTTVMISVVRKSFHHSPSVRIVA